jgi:tripartite-type tricarboxylate transporter receptor subunit TctC
VAPKDTPMEIVTRVQQEFGKGLQNSDLKAKLGDLSAEPIVNTPDAFGREWKQEAQIWKDVTEKLSIKLD